MRVYSCGAYLGGKVLGEEAVGLEAAAGHHDEDVEGCLADRWVAFDT